MDNKRLEWIYKTMLTIRNFEDKALSLFESNQLRGSVHLCTGQEAVAATVCSHLRDEDYITSTHRGHGHCIAKGAEPDLAMAELMGKSTGYCLGRGGSMHIADVTKGNLGANAIVAAGLPIASGAALSAKQRATISRVLIPTREAAVGLWAQARMAFPVRVRSKNNPSPITITAVSPSTHRCCARIAAPRIRIGCSPVKWGRRKVCLPHNNIANPLMKIDAPMVIIIGARWSPRRRGHTATLSTARPTPVTINTARGNATATGIPTGRPASQTPPGQN